MAEISNNVPDIVVSGTSEADTITNYGSNVTIDGGSDKDFLINGGYWESERGGANVSLMGGEGNDTITSHGSKSVLDGGTGNDLIYNGYRYYQPWDAFYDSDSDEYNGNHSTILGGTGNDTIKNRGSNVIIDAGAGNDSIENNGGQSVKISTSGGDNYIYNDYDYKYNSTTQTTDTINPEKATITTGAGNDTITNYGNKTSISSGAGNDTINNYSGDSVTIDAGASNDSINNHSNSVSIDAGVGNDYIHNYGYWNSETQTYEGANNVTIDTGTGNDYIYNEGNSVTITAGEGDDTIYNYGDNVTIDAGSGNNTVRGIATINMSESNSTLTGDSSVQTYKYVNGNHVITNYSGEDIIEIAAGKLDSYSFDGGDLIFHIGNGSLRLKNMTNHAITVTDSAGKTTTQIYGNGYSPQQVIKNFVHSMAHTILDTEEKLDEAIKNCSQFNTLQEVIDKMVADCRTANNADTFLRDYCGIILGNDDRNAVVGWDAGGLSMKTQSDLFPQSGDAIYPESTTFTIRGLTITVPEKDTLSEKEQLVVQGFYSWWAEEAIKLIEETFGFSFEGKSMTLSFFEDSDSFAWGLGGSGGVQVNMAFTNFEESDKNGNSLGDYLFPHEITHVLQGKFNIWSYMPNYMTEGMADLTAGNTRYMTELARNSMLLAQYLDLNNTFSSDTNVYAVGYMFWRYLMKQASDSYDSSKGYAWKDSSSIVGTDDAELLTGSGKGVTISAGTGNDTITAYGENMNVFGEDGDDYILISSVASGAKVDSGAGNDTITNYGSKTSISSGAGNDSIYNRGSNVTIDGGANRDFLINGGYWESERGGANVSIMGGTGNDTITSHGSKSVLDGGTGNDLIYNGYRYYQSWDVFYDSDSDEYNGNSSTILGGTGNDTIKNCGDKVLFKYAFGDGNDLIEGFNAKSTLSIAGGAYTSIKNNEDVIVNIGKNNITLQGAGNLSKVNIKGQKSTTLTLTNSMPSFVTVNSSVEVINASSRTTAIKITGNKLANSLVGGSGNDTLSGGTGDDKILGSSGNDSLSGGSGNDTLSGGTGDDKILGGSGNDCLLGGSGKDTLSSGSGDDKLLGGSGNDSLNGGDGKDTLSGGSGDDKILGGSGNDSLNGGDGKDTLSGGTGNDKLLGGSGNDCIKGGKGNDTLWGDAGFDKFIYVKGDGKDTIFGFDKNDTLTLDGLAFTTSYSKAKGTITFNVSGGSVMLKEFTATTFHINDDTYKISSSKLIKK
ncbi:MAG: hypothetical protein SR1Q5_01545 [Quinella sp. 1Q5]|nr:hypothetical protein [Quinella sp. 1Q5]